VKDPDNGIADFSIVVDACLGLFFGNGRALDFKDEFFFFPGDVGDSSNGGERLFKKRFGD
jgi:hypothetical protein